MEILNLVNEIKNCKKKIKECRDVTLKKELRVEYKFGCYKLCKLLNWNMKELMKYENDLDVYAPAIKVSAKWYATEVLGVSDEELKEEIYNATIGKNNSCKDNSYRCDRYNAFFESIYKAKDVKEAFKVIDEALKMGGVSIKRNLSVVIADFAVYNHPDKKNDVIVDLENKINAYKKHIGYVTYDEDKKVEYNRVGKRLEKERKIESAINMVCEFINGKYLNIKEFCEENNVDVGTFNQLLTVCMNKNANLYMIFLDELVKRANPVNESAIDLVKKISFLIQNGIKNDNGSIRDFDVIDFYLLTKMEWLDFYRIIISGAGVLPLVLSVHDQRIMREFFVKNEFRFRTNLFKVQDILDDRVKLGHISDNNISYYQVSLEEKKYIINFLDENNIPLNQLNYFNALDRYLNGTLIIGKENKNSVLTRRLKKD